MGFLLTTESMDFELARYGLAPGDEVYVCCVGGGGGGGLNSPIWTPSGGSSASISYAGDDNCTGGDGGPSSFCGITAQGGSGGGTGHYVGHVVNKNGNHEGMPGWLPGVTPPPKETNYYTDSFTIKLYADGATYTFYDYISFGPKAGISTEGLIHHLPPHIHLPVGLNIREPVFRVFYGPNQLPYGLYPVHGGSCLTWYQNYEQFSGGTGWYRYGVYGCPEYGAIGYGASGAGRGYPSDANGYNLYYYYTRNNGAYVKCGQKYGASGCSGEIVMKPVRLRFATERIEVGGGGGGGGAVAQPSSGTSTATVVRIKGNNGTGGAAGGAQYESTRNIYSAAGGYGESPAGETVNTAAAAARYTSSGTTYSQQVAYMAGGGASGCVAIWW